MFDLFNDIRFFYRKKNKFRAVTINCYHYYLCFILNQSNQFLLHKNLMTELFSHRYLLYLTKMLEDCIGERIR